MKINIKTKDICEIAIGVALYVVLSISIKLPLIGHIQSDLGYAALGAYCVFYGAAGGAIVGAVGCAIESFIFSGWFPPGWFLGQIFIGVFCGLVFKATGRVKSKAERLTINILVAVFALFVGIAIIKTAVECAMFHIPVEVKFVNNFTAFAADTPPMIVGVLIGDRFWRYGHAQGEV